MKDKGKKSKQKKKHPLTAATVDRHVLYEASVQSVEEHIAFIERTFQKIRGRKPRLLREDFCGTAKLACEWVERHSRQYAWGIDLDPEPLEWCRQHHLARLGANGDRIRLIQDNVLTAQSPPLDVVAAFNFSYSVFKTREQLLAYFQSAHRGLNENGLLVMDLFGGTDAVDITKETTRIKKRTGPDGKRIPAFTYIWEHESYNAINHHILCHIHFKFSDGSKMNKAFTYDWRLWSIPEIRELLGEAGFSSSRVYTHGWTKDGDADHIYRKRESFKNEAGWLAFIVGVV